MTESGFSEEGVQTFRRTVEIFIRLALIVLLLTWGFQIISPFIDLLAWAGIIAVALFPVARFIAGRTGGKIGRASALLTTALIALLILPTVELTLSSVDASKALATQLQEGTLTIPAPSEGVKDWPLIGDKTYELWSQASTNLESTLRKFEDEIKEAGSKLLGAVASTGVTILKFTFATIIAGVFMANAEAMRGFMNQLSSRLVGQQGEHFVNLATATIRSVAQGVLGIAVIQATAAAIGMSVMGIPLAALWALAVLMMAIVQLPPLLILGPIAAYGFTAYDTGPAVIFAVFCIVVSISDTFLKPLLLGRGVEVPMLVILLGAIGGMIVSGIIGLFVGSVVLALIYQLFTEWLNQHDSSFEENAVSDQTDA